MHWCCLDWVHTNAVAVFPWVHLGTITLVSFYSAPYCHCHSRCFPVKKMQQGQQGSHDGKICAACHLLPSPAKLCDPH